MSLEFINFEFLSSSLQNKIFIQIFQHKPFYYTNNNGNNVGISAVLLDYLAEYLNFTWVKKEHNHLSVKDKGSNDINIQILDFILFSGMIS